MEKTLKDVKGLLKAEIEKKTLVSLLYHKYFNKYKLFETLPPIVMVPVRDSSSFASVEHLFESNSLQGIGVLYRGVQG